MQVIRSKEFTPPKAWQAIDVACMNGISTRIHWTDTAYQWHVNDGQEVFAVLTGVVDMHYRDQGQEHVVRLEAGDVFYADIGCEHVAHPVGEARVLVVERQGSV